MAKHTLNNVEFIALKMAANPGRSGRYYRRALFQYRWPLQFVALLAEGADLSVLADHGAEYFRRRRWSKPKFAGRYWVDEFDPGHQMQYPRSRSWVLTEEGKVRARQAAEKVGIKLDI